ncbi:unnamed protein product [Toxocara canis]|uniref:Uncharacterized protein n=1 Tax=Toxocara canis TaxID=6265 RepID=A0A183V5P2_TOXCA|nr:unnamed protein product [Toxocara canis]
MANILSMSKAGVDVLTESSNSTKWECDNGSPAVNVPAQRKDLEAPKRSNRQCIDHELLSDHSRMLRTVANVVDEQRMIRGSAHAEHLIRELYTASQINRGPPGFSNSSRVHWDLLLGRDETIEPADYLNFDYDAKY